MTDDNFKKIKDIDWNTVEINRPIDKSLTGSFDTSISFWFDKSDDNKSTISITIPSQYFVTDISYLPVLSCSLFEIDSQLFINDIFSFWHSNTFAEMVSIVRKRNISIVQSFYNDLDISSQKFPTLDANEIASELKAKNFSIKSPPIKP